LSVRGDYRHALPVFGLVVVVLALAGVARALAKPPTFGQFGFFRGVALQEARARFPRVQDVVTCTKCHVKEARQRAKDAHGSVPCTTCHGPGDDHAQRGTADSSHVMRVKDSRTLCLSCHLELPARPSSFPQINIADHFKLVGVAEAETPCTACHDPHEPLFMDRDLPSARLHPIVHRCRDCHQGSARDASTPRPPEHPQIFDCGYCHAPIVKDAATRAHKAVRCTTCHLFLRQSDFAGRIIRDTDPRFCLLCHRDADFRSADAPPSIVWPQHRDEMGKTPADGVKRCVDCHQDRIHRLGEDDHGL
jgi:hypothetical protein